MFVQTKALPRVLTFSQAKYYIFSAVFTAGAVSVPWFLHRFNLAGPQFLPMHFFIFIAGFLFGWRMGLVTALSGILISYNLTYLPPMAILPQVMLELAVYGLAIGILREKNLNIWVSLFGAMALGRLARILFIIVFTPQMSALKFIEISWPGIILQLAIIPLIVFFIQWKMNLKNS